MESLNLFNTQYPTPNIQPVKDWIKPWNPVVTEHNPPVIRFLSYGSMLFPLDIGYSVPKTIEPCSVNPGWLCSGCRNFVKLSRSDIAHVNRFETKLEGRGTFFKPEVKLFEIFEFGVPQYGL